MVIPSEFEHEQIKKLESDKTKDQVVKKSPTRQNLMAEVPACKNPKSKSDSEWRLHHHAKNPINRSDKIRVLKLITPKVGGAKESFYKSN